MKYVFDFANLHRYCTAQLPAQAKLARAPQVCLERVSYNVPKSLIITVKETETYHAILKGTLNTSLEACESLNFVDMKKSLAWLMSALKTRTTAVDIVALNFA